MPTKIHIVKPMVFPVVMHGCVPASLWTLWLQPKASLWLLLIEVSPTFSKIIYSVNMTKVNIVSFVGPSFTSDCRKWIVNILELGTFKKLALTGET